MTDTNTDTVGEDFPPRIPTEVSVQDPTDSAPAAQQPQRRQRSREESTGHFPATSKQRQPLLKAYELAGETPPMPVEKMSRLQASRELQRLYAYPEVRQQWEASANEEPMTDEQDSFLNDVLYRQAVEAGVADQLDLTPIASKAEASHRIDETQRLIARASSTRPFQRA